MSTLSFALPLMIAWRATPQLVGVEVSPFGVATVTGANVDWLKQQAIALVRALAPDWSEPIMAVLTTPEEPGPTISGPMRPKRCATIQLVFPK